jgi:hypothetical protein
MDITIKVIGPEIKKRNLITLSVIKKDILPLMQEYIKDNKHHYIDIFFSSEEESKQLTYDELFNPK